jgi:hypothetical protein
VNILELRDGFAAMRAAHQQYVPAVDRSFFVFEPNPASSVTPTDHLASEHPWTRAALQTGLSGAIEVKSEVVTEPVSLPARNCSNKNFAQNRRTLAR